MPDRLRTSTKTRQAIYQQVAGADHPLTREEIVDEIDEEDSPELSIMLDELVDGEYLKRSTDVHGQPVYTLGQHSPWFG